MRIYTRTGDGGDTGLQGGMRISKSHPRIAAYGAVDEANAALGVALAYVSDPGIRDVLTGVQGDLFVVGADLSNPNLNDARNRVTKEMVSSIERRIDGAEEGLPPLANFVLPGGSVPASHVHHARAIARRAEAMTVLLSDSEEINHSCITYLNRLSDLLFVIGRQINKREGIGDSVWRGQASKDKL